MRIYCDKHLNQNGFKIPILMTPIGQEQGILQFYCPKCDQYYYSRDCLTFYLKKADVKEL
jgi:hypothetical protein